jgi:alginate O-acetyltransferase complex protein AlgI
MLPNSLGFLAFFAAIVLVHYALPRRHRWWLLLLASLYFYSTFDPRYLLLIGYATLVAWGAGLMIARTGRRGWVAAGVVAELGVLVLFKYVDFILGMAESVLQPVISAQAALALPRLEWLLPVGLSFYVFSCISYIVDVGRGKQEAERHLGHLALFVAFFPKLIAGPIERAPDLLPQLKAGGVFAAPNVTFGLQLLLWGLIKKVVIADGLVGFVDAGFSTPDFQSPVTVLIAVYFYAFQIYCDFSGYSDMAIGMAAILGFRFLPNFRRPYLSRNIAEFWSARWHISLSRWFRDYLYIPLGGNRVGPLRAGLNLLIVFAVSGLWHGAALTFLVWGLLNGLWQVLWQVSRPLLARIASLVPSALFATLSVLVTFHLVLVTWVFFRAADIPTAVAVLRRVATSIPQLPSLLQSYVYTPALMVSFALIVALMIVECVQERRPVETWLPAWPQPARWGAYYAGLALLVLGGHWGASEFVYMQF